MEGAEVLVRIGIRGVEAGLQAQVTLVYGTAGNGGRGKEAGGSEEEHRQLPQ